MYIQEKEETKIFRNKNFLNNQNYIINKNLKIDLINIYFNKDFSNILDLIFSLIISFRNKILIFLYKNIFKTRNYLLFYIILSIIFIPIFIYINIFWYFLVLIFTSFYFVNYIEDINEIKVYILRINKRNTNKFNSSYKSSLIDYVYFSKEYFSNNLNILIISFFYSLFFSFLLFIINKFYA